MMHEELERIAKRTFTAEQFNAINDLYMACGLNKYDFVKAINSVIKAMPESKPESRKYRICIRDRSGYRMTPNHCWYHTILAELVNTDIRSGRMIFREIPNSYELRTGYDFDEIYDPVSFE